MLSKKFQRKIYEAHKANPYATVKHGNYEYAIAYNATASIHTWIVRAESYSSWQGDFHWLQPLDEDIK